MQRLSSEQISSIRPHFDTPNLRLVVDSMISGRTPTRVWVDDNAVPRTVLTWEGRCIYLTGDLESAEANRGLRELFLAEILPEGHI